MVYVLFGILVAAELLLLAGEQSVDGGVELVAALEEVELEDEDVFNDLAAELLDEGTRSRCGAAWWSCQHTVPRHLGWKDHTHQSQ